MAFLLSRRSTQQRGQSRTIVISLISPIICLCQPNNYRIKIDETHVVPQPPTGSSSHQLPTARLRHDQDGRCTGNAARSERSTIRTDPAGS